MEEGIMAEGIIVEEIKKKIIIPVEIVQITMEKDNLVILGTLIPLHIVVVVVILVVRVVMEEMMMMKNAKGEMLRKMR
jgi:signal transduction histidine kinase